MSHPFNPFADTSTLDFIAFQIYVEETRRSGGTPVLWLTMRADLQQHYLTKAADRYTAWVEGERVRQVRRAGP